MKALAHDTLPLATTPAFTPRGPLPSAQARGDWTRAFADALRAEPLFAAPVRNVQRAHGAAETAKTALTAATASLGAAPDQARAVAAPAVRAGLPAREQDRCVALTRIPAEPQSIDAREEPSHTASEPTRARPALRADEHAPVRVHVEQDAHGLAIWVGCDAGIPPAQVAALLTACRTVAAPVASIVCNGAPAYLRSIRSQESP